MSLEGEKEAIPVIYTVTPEMVDEAYLPALRVMSEADEEDRRITNQLFEEEYGDAPVATPIRSILGRRFAGYGRQAKSDLPV